METKNLLDLCAEKWAQHFKALGFETEIFATKETNFRFVGVNYDKLKDIHICCQIINNGFSYHLFSYDRKPSYHGYICANEHEMLAKVLNWLYEGE